MEETDNIKKNLPNQEFDYIKIGKILISRWYWIAATVILCMIAASVYLWYTPKTYATSATMKFEDKKSELTDLVSVINADKGPSRIQTENFVLQSRKLILSAIKDLDYRISFYIEGHVRTSELYPNKPLKIALIKFDSLNFYHGLISYSPINKSTFSLTYKEGEKEIKKTFFYYSPVNINSTIFTVNYPGEISKNAVFLFKFNLPEDFIGRVSGGLHTNEIIKNSNIISLQETDSNPVFAADILNALMKEYLKYDHDQKTQSATQIIQFIDNQLDTLTDKVKGSEKSIESFKQNTKMLDVTSTGDFQLGKSKELGTQQSLLKIQLIAIDQLRQQIEKEKNNVNINFNIEGNIDPMLSALINSLNSLLIEKNELLKTYNNNARQIQDINGQILQVKNSALENITATRQRIQKNIDYLNAQVVQVNQQLSTLPMAERNLGSLKRDFEINEKVYSFLSEKKLEALISRSSILPGASIIEPAQPNYGPVSPNETEIKHTAIIFGLLIGLGLIVLIRVLNPYIYDKETVESLTTVPIIGVIRKFPHNIDENSTQIMVLSQPKSIFAESVRSVRTNLSFLASEKASKVICITSEVAGEGKSFVSVNLSSTLALIDKKIILIAADLRRSKLHKTFKLPNDIGLSNYLSNQNSIDEIIIHTSQENLDFIPSGPVPPNPSELLHTDKMKSLIAELKLRYDVIMIDTAPVGLVSDAIPLIRQSDINVFVIRSGKSKFYAATIPQRIANEYHLDNNVIILNAFEENILHSRYYTTKLTGESSGRYYYYSDYSGYQSSGYYVDNEEKKWWNIRRWFKI